MLLMLLSYAALPALHHLVCVAPSEPVQRAGDHLVAIDGKNTQNMTMQEVRLQLFVGIS